MVSFKTGTEGEDKHGNKTVTNPNKLCEKYILPKKVCVRRAHLEKLIRQTLESMGSREFQRQWFLCSLKTIYSELNQGKNHTQ